SNNNATFLFRHKRNENMEMCKERRILKFCQNNNSIFVPPYSTDESISAPDITFEKSKHNTIIL
ncbi:hypothetical protein LOAG_14614, partial [Loa loa]